MKQQLDPWIINMLSVDPLPDVEDEHIRMCVHAIARFPYELGLSAELDHAQDGE